ncbi:immediate early response gene 2 protein [Sphaeramia orbicularis]|uniref:Immediate early response gene 2 protein-like n=1 Tax=Sphaeramia orbicularis TaxID=375764 RepID=A0A672YIR6_9TELE|nr:immediate early response gene 2 protein-like [Sphaeramia orbicularis]
MEVSAEAKRIMVVALGKLYSSRTQRGGLRLHRSLLLTLVMKSARDIYHAAQTTTADSFGTGCEQENQETEVFGDSTNTHVDLQGSQTGVTGQTEAEEEVTELRHDAQTRTDHQNKENAHPNRKRRGKVCATPDFLPCKKAKLEQNCPQQLAVNPVLMDYVNCGSILSAPPAPMPVLRPIAAC